MRRLLAAAVDLAAGVALGDLAFRLALAGVPCRNLGDCPPLGPLVALAILLALVLYFGAGYLLWRCTPGEALTLRHG